MSNRNIYTNELNVFIRNQFRRKKSASKIYENPFFRQKIGDISFEEFVKERTRSEAFSFASYLIDKKDTIQHIQERAKIDAKEYQQALSDLKDMTSCGKTADICYQTVGKTVSK